jgi:multiple sugar transport system permease protein
MVTTAFKLDEDIFNPSTVWVPTRFTLIHFSNVLRLTKSTAAHAISDNFLLATFNSIIYVVISTVCVLLFSSMAAYVLAKKRFKHDDILLLVIVGTMMIPDPMSIIPNFLLISHLGWMNTWPGLLSPGLLSAFSVFFLRQSMLSIPDELLDSAKIDGANDFRIFWWIIIPLSIPVLAALGIATLTSRWNEFIWPLIVTSRANMILLSVAQSHLKTLVIQPGDLMAGAAYSAAPLLIIYALFSRQFVTGLTSGALKY